MRSFALWDWLRKRYFDHHLHQKGNWSEFKKHGEAYLFIVHPQNYGVASFFTFGAHGCKCAKLERLSPLLLMPRLLFYVPILTDILQYFGGIANSREHIEKALGTRKSVVWAPLGPMMTSHDIENGIMLQADALSIDTFEWLVKYGERCSFKLVPVCHVGEENVYSNYNARLPRWIKQIQGYFRKSYDYEWPLAIVGWGGTFLPKPCTIYTKVGAPVSTMQMDNGEMVKKSAAQLRSDVINEYNRLNVKEAGENDMTLNIE